MDYTILGKIVQRIDQVLKSNETDREERIKELKDLSRKWSFVLFPEYSRGEGDSLREGETLARWHDALKYSNLDAYELKEQIILVLEWTASGGNFYWLK